LISERKCSSIFVVRSSDAKVNQVVLKSGGATRKGGQLLIPNAVAVSYLITLHPIPHFSIIAWCNQV